MVSNLLANILRFLPKGLVKRIYHQTVRLHESRFLDRQSKIPKNNFSPRHLANAKIVVNRNALLELLPKNAVVAELGVDEGKFSKKILEITQPARLHLVDNWQTARYHDGKRKSVENQLAKELSNEQVVINRGLSTELASSFTDGYFDWIYIDTDHTYETTSRELELFRTKMKTKGIICGHDFCIGYWQKMSRYGVIEAVIEFCHKYDWELIYLTSEFDRAPSFAIRAIV